MVTIDKIGGAQNTKSIEMKGLSIDEKPINEDIVNGSTFYEMDTQELFMFDEQNQQWIRQ